jgi:hypothetical protein
MQLSKVKDEKHKMQPSGYDILSEEEHCSTLYRRRGKILAAQQFPGDLINLFSLGLTGHPGHGRLHNAPKVFGAFR